jgi:hypothetical protein
MQRINVEFQKAGLRGISILIASGDSGAGWSGFRAGWEGWEGVERPAEGYGRVARAVQSPAPAACTVACAVPANCISCRHHHCFAKHSINAQKTSFSQSPITSALSLNVSHISVRAEYLSKSHLINTHHRL